MVTRIPDKLYFKIGEVAALASLRPSVLRYWETEFSVLKPAKSRTGQRLYTRQDVDTVITIKNLLYNEKLTIEGARKKIKTASKKSDKEIYDIDNRLTRILSEIREDLQDIRRSLL